MADLPEYRVDRRWLANVEEMTTDAHEMLMLAIGRIHRELDRDVGLLMESGVEVHRMSIMTFANDPARRALAVDGKKVREYVITFKEERHGAQVLDRHETRWLNYADMTEHTRSLADAVCEWVTQEMTETGDVRSFTVNTPIGPIEVRRR